MLTLTCPSVDISFAACMLLLLLVLRYTGEQVGHMDIFVCCCLAVTICVFATSIAYPTSTCSALQSSYALPQESPRTTSLRLFCPL